MTKQIQLTESAIARFWSKVDKSNDCWIWNGSVMNNGYGEFAISRSKNMLAHRLSWMLHFGPIPDKMYVCHKCDNKRCIKPDHLFIGTQKENMRDCAQKGRAARGDRCVLHVHSDLACHGERHYKTILKEQDVLEIRRLGTIGMNRHAIAELFGITRSSVCSIIRRTRWRQLK